MQQENNLENFKNIYDFTKRNYNIIIHGLAGIGKFNFILSVIDYYYEKFEISKNNDIKLNPDIFYVSLPLYNSSGKISGILNNDERLLFEYNLIDDVDGLKIGKNITIDQIREIGNFASLSSNNNHKIIIINSCDFLNKESAAALLKTLEESKSKCIFFLLTSNISNIQSTISSRCHKFAFSSSLETRDTSSFSSYFYSKIPQALETFSKYNIDLIDDEVLTELNSLFNKEDQSFIQLSDPWKNRGYLLLDYLIELFLFLIKSEFISDPSVKDLRKKIMHSIDIDISGVNRTSLIRLIDVLLHKKRESFLNLNPKIFYDNLLIELRENI